MSRARSLAPVLALLVAALLPACSGTPECPANTLTTAERDLGWELTHVYTTWARMGLRPEPVFLKRVLDASGQLRNFVNVYLGDRNVRALDGLDSQVAAGSVIHIVPAVAGGGRP